MRRSDGGRRPAQAEHSDREHHHRAEVQRHRRHRRLADSQAQPGTATARLRPARDGLPAARRRERGGATVPRGQQLPCRCGADGRRPADARQSDTRGGTAAMSERDPTESTQLVPVLIWHDPRVQLLDDTWLLTICAALLAIALPWLVSGLRIEFAASAAGLLVLGAIHVVLAAMSGVRPTSQRRETLRLSSLHALGVITIAFIWQHAGGLQNPLFLVVFAIPVIAAIFLSRWQPYLMAALVVLTVTLLACSEAPQLRWYAPWLGAPGGWLAGLLGGAGATQQPFAAFYAPSQYFIVLLEVFAIMVFACAVAAEYLATIFERLDAQVSAARAEAAPSQELWSTLVEQLPVPAMLLDATSREIVGASGSAVKKFLSDAAPAVGRDFFDAVRFSYPEPIERLIDGADGVEPLSMIQLDGRVLASEVRVQHLAQHGRRFALVVVNDTSEEFCVKAALDAAEYAA